MRRSAVYVASCGQHAGKTSTCTGLVRGLQGLFQPPNVGYVKPVGQQSLRVRDTDAAGAEIGPYVVVDKDAPVFHDVLGCSGAYADMSPVIVHRGYTRSSLTGRIDADAEFARVEAAFERVAERNLFTVVEGTGHVAVGACVGLSNAHVAARMRLPMVLVVNGGIGSTLDEFFLNHSFCQAHGASVRGVILNKVIPEKLLDVRAHVGEALMRECGVPLLGCVPDLQSLGAPTDKLNVGDRARTLAAANHYASHIDLTAMLHAIDFGAEHADAEQVHAAVADANTGAVAVAAAATSFC